MPPSDGAQAKSITLKETKAMAAVSANKLELLQIADAVAREKSIDRSIVIAAMEDAIAKAARARASRTRRGPLPGPPGRREWARTSGRRSTWWNRWGRCHER